MSKVSWSRYERVMDYLITIHGAIHNGQVPVKIKVNPGVYADMCKAYIFTLDKVGGCEIKAFYYSPDILVPIEVDPAEPAIRVE